MDQAASTPRTPSTTLSALEQLRHWWNRLAASVLGKPGDAGFDPATARLLDKIKARIDESRAQRGGEISARKRAEEIAAVYGGASLPQRAAILNLITREFAPDRDALEKAISALRSAANDAELSHAEARLRGALNHPRAKFFAQFNLLPEGVKFLVDLRADLLGLLPNEPALEVLKVELDELLESWFDPGFLELQRITWQSPALLLEKLFAYEAVHPIESWNDLRNRLDTDRRCYAFFHPRLPNEPIIFVEIALAEGLPRSVQMLLDQNAPLQDPRSADTAVFYSISNAQKGLRGISFGNLLLKRVIEDLRRDLPRLRVFCTLSPIPGFRKWLDRGLAEKRVSLPQADLAKFAQSLGHPQPGTALSDALGRPDWPRDPRLVEALREPMEKLCAHYLLEERSGAHPVDPVAQFHLNNGARVNGIYWLADTSSRGLRQSYGLMVSYCYDPNELDDNHEQFQRGGRIVAARRVQKLLG